MHPTRSALIVHPSYNLARHDDDFEKRTQEFLVKAGIMPKPLSWVDDDGKKHGYDFDKDLLRFKNILSNNQYDDGKVKVIQGIISTKELTTELEHLLENNHPDSTAVFIFCGHGSSDDLTHEHGSMLLSRGEHFTTVRLRHILAEKHFRGTFISVFNMCGATAIAPLPLDEGSVSYIRQNAIDKAKLGEIHPQCKCISIYSSGTFESTTCGPHGTKLANELNNVFIRGHHISYNTFSLHIDGKQVSYQGQQYAGCFFGPARNLDCQVSKTGQSHIRPLDVQSDGFSSLVISNSLFD